MAILQPVGLAIAATTALNVALYFAGKAAGASYIAPQGPDQVLAPVLAVAVVGATVVSMVIGTLVYLGLRKLAPSRGWTIFLALTGLLVVASFLPFGSPDIDGPTKIFLGLMHVTTPAGLLLALAKARRAA